jgi:hypothetical protein
MHSSDSFRRVRLSLFLLLGAALPTGSASYTSATPPTRGPTVPGNVAVLRGRIAYAPANAPEAVKRAIWATNYLTNKPYEWGGGHATFYDNGYDCSGTISFLLRHAGALESPAPSRHFLQYGNPGRGRWITVYARNGHVFATVAGLRLDTTGRRAEEGPRWRVEPRSPAGFAARHPQGL